MDSIPIEILFPATVLLLVIAIEFGYRAANMHPAETKNAKEKITSSNAAAILGLLGFILVFTFGIVYSRYDSRKELVRHEANMIRTAWLRSDFLPEGDRLESEKLLIRYVDIRMGITELDKVEITLKELNQIQYQVWNIAVKNARLDMNSDVAALYIEALNDMINQQALRVAVGLQARIPNALWVFLYLLVIMGMFSVGYQASISGSSRKSWLTPVMILSFSIMIMLIASLDRPDSKIMEVSAEPLHDLRRWIEESKK